MECELKKNTKPCNLRYEAFLSIFSFIPGQRLHYRTLSHSFLYSTLAVLEPKVGSTMNRFCEYVRRKSTLAILSFVRYDTRCYFNVRSKADISQLNLPHGTDN